MKKSIFTASILTVGFIIGASALTVLAQTAWKAPGSTPPNCVSTPVTDPAYREGCNPPINSGASDQFKTGLLTLANFIYNHAGVANVTPGHVLTAIDPKGTVAWAPLTASPASCRVLTATSLPTGGSLPDFRAIDVAPECINGACSLVLAIYDAANAITTIRMATLTEYMGLNSAGVDYYWAKAGTVSDGSSCVLGKNGSTVGCDAIVNWNDASGNQAITLYDDHNNGESNESQWTIRDTNPNHSSILSVCR